MQAVENVFWAAVIFFFMVCLAACGSGSDTPDISITNNNSANSDAENVNDSQNGDTQCSTDYSFNEQTSTCHFTQTCDGHAVSSGDFAVTATSPCPAPTPEPAPVVSL